MPALARRPLLLLSCAVAVVLVALSGRYGYHRDELYFLACGRHLAWGYPDQPPLVPLLARAMSAIAPGSLPMLRLPSAIAMGLLIFLTGMTARELGAGRQAQVLAAGVMAISGIVLAAGHLLSTTTFDVLLWTAFLWLVVRVLRTGDARLWLPAGVVAGLALEDKGTIAALVLAIAIAIAIVGPRDVFRSPMLAAATVIAGAMWTPYLVWQAQHGWPQLHVAGNIASGGSGTSSPRAAFLPLLVVLVSPWLTPVWVVGLVRLLRRPALRTYRAIGLAFVLLCVLVVVAGGKPYYVAGMFPVLLAAGSQPIVDWARRARRRVGWLVAAFVLGLPTFVVTLPVLPQATLRHSPVLALNYDAGETVGWPTYVREIARVYDAARGASGRDVGIVTANYGEAGAVDRYGASLGLPHAHSGHNGYWWWGPPTADTVVAVGLPVSFLHSVFTDVHPAGRLDNRLGLDDDEQHVELWVCSDRVDSWRALWPRFRSLG